MWFAACIVALSFPPPLLSLSPFLSPPPTPSLPTSLFPSRCLPPPASSCRLLGGDSGSKASRQAEPNQPYFSWCTVTARVWQPGQPNEANTGSTEVRKLNLSCETTEEEDCHCVLAIGGERAADSPFCWCCKCVLCLVRQSDSSAPQLCFPSVLFLCLDLNSVKWCVTLMKMGQATGCTLALWICYGTGNQPLKCSWKYSIFAINIFTKCILFSWVKH